MPRLFCVVAHWIGWRSGGEPRLLFPLLVWHGFLFLAAFVVLRRAVDWEIDEVKRKLDEMDATDESSEPESQS